MRARSTLPLASQVLAALLVVRAASALVWPDVLERLEHDLASQDAGLRTAAAEKLDVVGRGRSTPLILRALADAEASVRLAAAETAIRARTPGATAVVIPWLGEHDARLRQAACGVAHAVPDVRAVAPLARALSDGDGAVRAAAIQALGVQGSKDAVAPLLGKLDDPIPGVRVELARALAHLHDERAVVPLIGKVEDSVPEVREAVARALGELGDPRAASAIVLQLRDASPEVRVTALAALGKVHGGDTVDAVIPLVTDRSPTVRHAALTTLGELAKVGSVDALRVLIARLGLDDDATAELQPSPVREALVEAGDPVVGPLTTLLRGGSSGPSVSSAAWVLAALRASAASPDIVAAVRRGTLHPAAGLRALAATGGGADLPFVLEFVGSSNPTVRAEALAATGALLDSGHADGRVVEPLVAAAEGARLRGAELVRVLELLGRSAAVRAAPILQGYVRSHDVATRLAAIDALGTLGPTPSSADGPLLALLRDPLPEVRLHAADALATTGGAQARDALLDALKTGAEVDRIAALHALRGVLLRAPSDAAWHQLAAAMDLAAGGERDALLLVLGKAAPVHPYVEALVASSDADDRRTALSACAGRTEATPLEQAALSDPDASVRAEAAWGLATTAGRELVPQLQQVVRSATPAMIDSAINATGALARVAGRTHQSEATTALCLLLGDSRTLVRANALVGLSLAAVRCGAGEVERRLLNDASQAVRGAAARAVAAHRTREDDAALARCSTNDRSAEVAGLCRTSVVGPSPTAPRRRNHETVAYVEGLSTTPPLTHASFHVQLGDGVIRAGTADRRGAFFEPNTPPGLLRLLAPEPGP